VGNLDVDMAPSRPCTYHVIRSNHRGRFRGLYHALQRLAVIYFRSGNADQFAKRGSEALFSE
jgi:hypothetical protein